ncbi:hypothetical protein I3842_15G147900 [Carya illinoinensis]|uniref:Uncharacterized protein n=1 Tax=Carya illinoinensis TaxID=32201 RepID=A0A922AET6_CARIL|nr:hypothetical protein I3842_15G147900 [Carya illinoinensis]
MLTNRFQAVTAPSRALSSLVSPLECLFLAIMAGNASCLNAWVVALLFSSNGYWVLEAEELVHIPNWF